MDKEHLHDTSTIYQIRVKGFLDLKWSDWFDGFTIEYINGDTTLTGVVRDQANLHGLLAKIRNLGLILLRVELIENTFRNLDGDKG